MKFVVPSVLGLLIFLTPVPWNGQLTIVIGIITGWIKTAMGESGLWLVVAVMVLTVVMTLMGSLFKVAWIRNNHWLASLFSVPLPWIILRCAGMVFGLIYLFQFGPQILRSEEIGGAVFVGIAVNSLAVYISACILLPLLTDFGFMEFTGTLARPFFNRVFRLPGRAAIDATASLVGAASVGLLITIEQYERGYYSAREACVIATNFSIVSIPFSLVIVAVAGIEQYFVAWYGVVILTCLLATFITPRLPPLSRKSEAHLVDDPSLGMRRKNDHQGLLAEAWAAAIARAQTAPGLRGFFAKGLRNLAYFLSTIIAAGMGFAIVAALITFHTPIFSWLAYPFIPLLELVGLGDASGVAPGLFSGFLDQYMPAIVASGIEHDRSSFVLAGLSVCQLIFTEFPSLRYRCPAPIRV